MSRQFVGRLYDVLVEHKGLLLTLVASDGLSEEEIEGAGIADIRRPLTLLGQISAEGMRLRGLHSGQPDLPALHGRDDRRHGRAAINFLRKSAAVAGGNRG